MFEKTKLFREISHLILILGLLTMISGCVQRDSQEKSSSDLDLNPKLNTAPPQSLTWHFDEGVGKVAKANDPRFPSIELQRKQSSPLWAPGVKGKALNFLGRGDASGCFPKFFKIDKDFSVDFFIKLIKAPEGSYGGIFDLMIYHRSGFRIVIDKGGNILWIIQAPNARARELKFSGPKLPFGEWRHLAFVKKDNTLEIFMDNERVVSEVLPGNVKSGPKLFRLGNTGGPKYNLNGLIDELRLSNHPRSDFSAEKKLVATLNDAAAKLAMEKKVLEPEVAVNLLENGDFESGMSLWNYKIFTGQIPYDSTWFLDEDEKTSGKYSLRLNKTYTMMLAPHLVEVTPGANYTFAADLKTDVPGTIIRMNVYDERNGWGKAKIRKNFKLGKDWQRCSFNFQVPKNYTNRLECSFYLSNPKSSVWIDRVSVCPGAKSEPDKPEIPLGLTTTQPGNTFFTGEKVELNVNFTPGAVNIDGKIYLQALDAWGKSVWEKEIAAKSQSLILPLEQGLYCVKALYKNAAGNIEKEVGARIAVIPSGQASRFFGIQYGYGYCPKQANEQAVKRRWKWGAKTGRSNIMSVEQMLNCGPDTRIVKLLRMSKKQGIDVYACLIGHEKTAWSPHRKHAYDMNYDGKGIVTAENLSQWGKALRNFLKHAGPYISGFEVFNEPNCWKDVDGRILSGSDYVKALKLSYEICKEMFPNIQVYGPSITGLAKSRMKFLEEVLQAGGGDYMDALSFHPYGNREDDEYTQIAYLKNLVEKYKPGLAICNTEVGGSHYHNPKYRMRSQNSVHSVTPYLSAEISNGERTHARRLIKNAIACKALNVEFFTYHYEGVAYGGAWGVLLDMTGAPNLLGTAFIFMNRLLHKAKPLGPLAISDVFKTFLFKRLDGRPAAVLWAAEKDLDCSLRIDTAAENLELFDISGMKRKLTGKESVNVAVNNIPIYLIGKNMSISEFKETLKESQLVGIKNPITVKLELINPKRLDVIFKNRLSNPLSIKGSQKIEYGDEKKIIALSIPKLMPGKPNRQSIALKKAIRSGFIKYDFQGKLDNNVELKMENTLNMMYCHPVKNIRIDGDMAEWKDIPSLKMGGDRLIVIDHDRGRDGDKDHYAKVWLGHDRDNIYFAAEIDDEKHVQSGEPKMTWRGDGVQFFFDPLGDSAIGVRGERDDYRFTIYLKPDGSKPILTRDRIAEFELCAMRGTGEIPEKDIPRAVRRANGKTFYEVCFPKTQLAPFDPTPGTPFRFSFLINDNDRPLQDKKMQKRDSGLSLTKPGTQPYSHPELYSDVICIEE